VANIKRGVSRRKREAAVEAMFSRMQREIDASHHVIWTSYFGEFARLNPRSTSGRFCSKFDEAWRRSMLPNTERDDITPNGNYHATGRDINGYVQPD
jgi:hypothetical protein